MAKNAAFLPTVFPLSSAFRIKEEFSAVHSSVEVEVGHPLHLGKQVLLPEPGARHGQQEPLGQGVAGSAVLREPLS